MRHADPSLNPTFTSHSSTTRARLWVVAALLATGLTGLVPARARAQDPIPALEARADHYAGMAHQIWEWAEVGYQEEMSSALLQEELAAHGFEIESGVAGMPTAFIATFGSGGPIIGILAEFDALPGISQDAVAERKPVVVDGAGHACGHHLFGTASVAAAIATKEWLESSGREGTLRLYGTPAEEGGAGKVYMVRDGLFEDVDIALHWHPGDRNSAAAGGSLANKSAKFRFRGYSAHAAGAPERGRSALDG
ncbi:MAG: amidohydrolase, partial [Gemmatimonadota bacterium]|nr:amidohydrolase [Gemmatimonadota bacterium]